MLGTAKAAEPGMYGGVEDKVFGALSGSALSLRDNSLFPIAPFRSVLVAGMISALVSALSGCERQFWDLGLIGPIGAHTPSLIACIARGCCIRICSASGSPPRLVWVSVSSQT